MYHFHCHVNYFSTPPDFNTWIFLILQNYQDKLDDITYDTDGETSGKLLCRSSDLGQHIKLVECTCKDSDKKSSEAVYQVDFCHYFTVSPKGSARSFSSKNNSTAPQPFMVILLISGWATEQLSHSRNTKTNNNCHLLADINNPPRHHSCLTLSFGFYRNKYNNSGAFSSMSIFPCTMKHTTTSASQDSLGCTQLQV